MIEARVRDFRIDSRLQKLCGKYLMELCGSMDSYDVDETDLNNCLQVGSYGLGCSHVVGGCHTKAASLHGPSSRVGQQLHVF